MPKNEGGAPGNRVFVEKSYVVFDVETGGLNFDIHPILEIGMLPLTWDRKEKQYLPNTPEEINAIVKPYASRHGKIRIEKKALEVNGLTIKELVKKGNDPKVVIDAVVSLASTLNKKGEERFRPILVGHNIASFDIPFLETMFDLYGKNLWHYFDKCVIDTLVMSRMVFVTNEHIESMSLTNVCNYLGIKTPNAHRAITDTRANAQLFLKFLAFMSIRRNRKDLLAV